jgi:malate dehydrogenase (oxaloacetate-decarboxylating)(NADP+)
VNGAGAAGIACLDLLKALGLRPQNVILCDTKGVVYDGRTEGMNQWKSAHAVNTTKRSWLTPWTAPMRCSGCRSRAPSRKR